MPHLSTDRLAALGDDAPTREETLHLDACAPCAAEWRAFVALVGMARAERETIGIPLSRWERLVPELPLGAAGPMLSLPVGVRRGPARWPLQVAAALLLCAGGAVLGRASAGAGLLPDRAAVASRPTRASTVAATRLLADSSSFASIDEARATQERSRQSYEQAAAFLAEHDPTAMGGSPVAYRSRLAALDRVISTTREALREAPHDPVMNDYYLTTIGQREATLRQLNTALPASLRLNSF
jgi:hypothetical protein